MISADPGKSILARNARRIPTWVRRYGLSLFAVAVATGLQFGLQQLKFSHLPYLLLFPAVVLVAMFLGFWPSVASSGIATIAGAYLIFVVSPSNLHTREDLVKPPLFLVFSMSAAVLIRNRKRSKDALLKSEDRYRDLVENSEDLVCTHDLEGRLISVNPAPARVLGYEVEELLQIPMHDVVAPEFRNQFDEYLSRIKKNGADKGLLCVVTRSGERRVWEYSNTLRTEGVASPIVRGIARDVTEKKRAEAALRNSEQRYRTLFEKTVAGVGIITVEGELIDCNDAWARMFGYGNAGECLGNNVVQHYFDPADREVLLQELKQSGSITNRELHVRRKDGTPLWLLVNDILLPDRQNPQLIQATVIDITARKLAEEALLRSEENYRNFVTQSSEGIFRQDLDAPIPINLPEDELVHRILHDSYLAECNDAIARMYGLTVQDFIGKRLTDTVDPNDPLNIELTREYIRGGFRVLERESHETDIQGNPKVFRNSMLGIIEDGKLVRTWGIQRDVTDRVKLEEARNKAVKALQEREEHFRILVEQASDGIFIANSSGKYVDVNTAGAEMLGYTGEEILQLSIKDVVVPEELEGMLAERDKLLTGQATRREWKFRRKDGSTFPGEVVGRLLPDGRLQGILRDMTERRRAEEAIRQSEERFRVALKDSPVTVFNLDNDLRYTWVYNPPPEWPTDVIGKTCEDVLGAKHAARMNQLKRRVLETGKGIRTELTFGHNGHRTAFDMTLEPLFSTAGEVVGITGSLIDVARLRELADRLEEQRDRLAREKSYLEGEIEAELGFEEIIGHSPVLLDVLKKVRVVASTDSTVLLLGETGTGKELVARALHSLSARRQKNFIKLNCAAVPSGLLESELFGHEKGAFTSAVSQKLGRLELADGGTLFLDEIGELPPELQPKLLRVLQDREFERLGGVRTLHVDVRIISATNRDLQKDVSEKHFREDLFYRLNVFPIKLPTLRERKSDIPSLVSHFVRKYAARMGKHIEIIPRDTMNTLQNWNWPGNVRELENMIERMVILTKGSTLAPPPAELDEAHDFSEDHLVEMEREYIIRVLRDTNGVLAGAEGAANRLGIKRTTLQSMLKRFGIEPHEYRRQSGTFDSH